MILELLEELKVVGKAANSVNVNHDKVAVDCGIGRSYLDRLRHGSRVPSDSQTNRSLIQSLIHAYRRELRVKKEDIENVVGK